MPETNYSAMPYKLFAIKTLQIYFVVLLMSFVLDFGYSAIKQQSITEPLLAWVSRKFTIKYMVISLIIAACAAYYRIIREKTKQ